MVAVQPQPWLRALITTTTTTTTTNNNNNNNNAVPLAVYLPTFIKRYEPPKRRGLCNKASHLLRSKSCLNSQEQGIVY
jgi:hypothetical protein